MFLDLLRRRNPGLLHAAAELGRTGELPANCYVLDLDAIEANAAAITTQADELSLRPMAMTKQVGRVPGFGRAVVAGGIEEAVAVDMGCARAVGDGGLRVGHLGHLVQVPHAEVDEAADLQPAFWTVFTLEQAKAASEAALARGREQPILLRVHADGDRFYPGHEGGFPADDIAAAADRVQALDGARIAGVTTFPALLFDPDARAVRPTPNLATLHGARERLEQAGFQNMEINAPGTTSASVLGVLADAGATQVEPGHALTGTTPMHAVEDLEERPALCYLTEVSHHHAGRAYVFGGGLYVDPVFGDYQPRAAVLDTPGHARLLDAELPPPAAIDYYGQLIADDAPLPRPGTPVVFGFRAQAFVTRAFVAGITGISVGDAKVAGVWTPDGRSAPWPR